MATKKTGTAKTTSTSSKAPGNDQDAQNPAIQDTSADTVDRSAEAHFLGTDALAGEPGEHGVPVEVEERDDSGDTDEYWLNDFHGNDVYQCKRCQFNTMDAQAFRDHWTSRHELRIDPPPEVKFPQFDRFGNYVPDAE